MTILYQQGLRKHPDIPNIPLVMELTDDPEIKQVLHGAVHRLRARPALFRVRRRSRRSRRGAAQRVQPVMKDKNLLADADKLNQEVNPFTGEAMQKVLADVYATPKPLIARLAQASKSKPDLKVLESQEGREEISPS